MNRHKKLAQLQRVVIAPAQLQNQQITLTAEQQHYLGRVLRLRVGEHFVAMNGQGQWWLAALEADQRAQVLELMQVHTELPVPITLMAALSKGNGFDEVVRQATELGVSGIVPILSDRTLADPSPQKLQRWRRIAQEAAEQSERQVVPQVLEPVPWAQGLAREKVSCEPLIGYFCVTRYSSPHLLQCLQKAPSSAIAVATGPEGGWTTAEVDQAVAAGFQPVSLGCRILRSVSAPLVALSLIAATLEFAGSLSEEGQRRD